MDDLVLYRMRMLGVVAISLFLVLGARLWFLQVLTGDEAAAIAETNITRVITIQAPRGRILDNQGRVLVGNRVTASITINRRALEEADLNESERRAMLTSIAVEVNRSGKLLKVIDLERALDNPSYGPYDNVPIAVDVSEDLLVYFGERPHRYPGVRVADASVRSFLYGDLAAHVLGWVGPVNDTELQSRRPREGKEYQLRDEIGKAGVELMFEDELRGVNGRRVLEVDRRGEVVRERTDLFVPPRAGNDVVLTIDIDLQDLVQAELERTVYLGRAKVPQSTPDVGDPPPFNVPGGAVVILDPTDGDVLAMASYPTYDPNESIGGFSFERWSELNDPANDLPMFNRAVQGEYAPGSTFKLFTAHAAWHEDVFGVGRVKPADEPWDDPGEYFLQSCRADADDLESAGGCYFKNAGKKPYEQVDLARSLTVSSDVYYYTIGESIFVNPRHSDTAIQDTATEYGFGYQTGVQLPFEQDGYVPTPERRAERHRQNPEVFPFGGWYPGDNVNVAVGQGEVLATPLQLANAYTVFANAGSRWAPNIVERIVDHDGGAVLSFGPRQAAEVEIDPAFRNRVLRGLVGVVADEEGTAYWAFNSEATDGTYFPQARYPLAGKTGTAEVRGRADTSLFAAFGPVQEPAYVVVAVLEEAGFGSSVAAPFVARVMTRIFEGTVPEAPTMDERYARSTALPLCIEWFWWKTGNTLERLESIELDAEPESGPVLGADGVVRVRGVRIDCEQLIDDLLIGREALLGLEAA